MPHNRILKNYGTAGIRDQGIPLRTLLVVWDCMSQQVPQLCVS
jgi:hypothetical protein